MTTLAKRYNAKAIQVMPHMADDLIVYYTIDKASDIDDLVFRRSEYLGGMAAVILRLVMMEDELEPLRDEVGRLRAALEEIASDPRDDSVCVGDGWSFYADQMAFALAALAKARGEEQ